MAKWTVQDMPDLGGRVAVVTGGNSGLGYHTAAGLAAGGARVIIACRNPGRAEEALGRLRAQHPDAELSAMALDLADLKSVAAFAAALSAAHPTLDILVNNAGVMALPLSRTADGFEMQIGTNHLGHFALTGQLLPLLEAADAARVVTVASMAHRWTPGIRFDDLNWEKGRYHRWIAYGQSKLANLLFTYELQRRLDRAGSTTLAAAAHPGYASTNLQYAAAEMKHSAFEKAYMRLANALVGQPAEMGALPTLYAAADPGVERGAYYGPDGWRQLRGYPRRVGSSQRSRDEAAAERLWSLSESLTGIRYLS